MQKICSGILIDEHQRVLLIKRKFNKSYGPNHWSFPGGKHEEGESAEEAAIREVREEVGLNFKITKLFAKEEGGNKNNYFYRFLGTYSGEIKIQEDECDGYGWFTYDELKDLLMNLIIRGHIQRLYDESLIK